MPGGGRAFRFGGGLELSPLAVHAIFCRVTVTSDIGETAQAFCCFETAKLAQPWQGRWIGLPQTEDFHPEYRKGFALSGTVRQARLYICGLGLFEARLNGEKSATTCWRPLSTITKSIFNIAPTM